MTSSTRFIVLFQFCHYSADYGCGFGASPLAEQEREKKKTRPRDRKRNRIVTVGCTAENHHWPLFVILILAQQMD